MNRHALYAMTIAGLAGFSGASAAATTPTAGPAPQPVYGDELERCVVALRPEAQAAGAAGVRHTVTDLRVRGLWREFTIESELAAPGGAALGRTTSRCRTERWGPATRLEVLSRQAPAANAAGDTRLAGEPRGTAR